MGPNPNGVAALGPEMNSEAWQREAASNECRNPVGVRISDRPSPRVAEYGNPGLGDTTPLALDQRPTVTQGSRVRQPWAEGHNPVGVGISDRPSPRVAEYGNPGLRDTTPLGLAPATDRHPG